MTYRTTPSPLSFPSLARLLGREIIIQWPRSTSAPLNGCAQSELRCQGASTTWPNCNWLQSALGSDPRQHRCRLTFSTARRTQISISQRGTKGLGVLLQDYSTWCVGGRQHAASMRAQECTCKNSRRLDVACFGGVRGELGLMIMINAALNRRCWWNTWAGFCKIGFEFFCILTEQSARHLILHSYF